jgi:hypothetical protein
MKKAGGPIFWCAAASALALALGWPAAGAAVEAVTQDEDVAARASARRLQRDLRERRLKLGASFDEILAAYGEPHRMYVETESSELRYRYSKGFDQGYVYIFLYFGRDGRLVQWHDSGSST